MITSDQKKKSGIDNDFWYPQKIPPLIMVIGKPRNNFVIDNGYLWITKKILTHITITSNQTNFLHR